jgi:hypothetical protein
VLLGRLADRVEAPAAAIEAIAAAESAPFGWLVRRRADILAAPQPPEELPWPAS